MLAGDFWETFVGESRVDWNTFQLNVFFKDDVTYTNNFNMWSTTHMCVLLVTSVI